MKLSMITMAVAVSLALTACISTPVRTNSATVSAAVAQAGAGAPRLPTLDEGYLDASWFNQPLTVDRAVQAALLNSPRVRAELARLDAAQAERVQAGLLRNPMASLMTLRPEGGGRFELDYSLTQSMFDLFTRSRRVALAEASQRRIEADVIGQLLVIVQETQAGYYDAMIDQAKARVLREQWALDNESLLLLQRQASQGAVPATTSLEQQAIVSAQAHRVQVAEAALVQARTTLALQLGLPSATVMVLPDALPAFTFPGLDAPAVQALAATHRPELQAAAAEVDQARAEQRLQTGVVRATDMALGPAGTRESDGLSLNGLSVQITLPIFDTGRARRDLATTRTEQAEFAEEAIRRQVPLEVERAIATLVAADNAAGHADHHLYQQQQLEQLARRNYEQGVSDRARYLQASRARLAAVMEQLDARQARWAALIALERATGASAIAPVQFRVEINKGKMH